MASVYGCGVQGCGEADLDRVDRWGLDWLYFGLELCFLYRGYVNVMDSILSCSTRTLDTCILN